MSASPPLLVSVLDFDRMSYRSAAPEEDGGIASGRSLMDMPMLDQAPDILRTLHYLSSLIHNLKNPLGTRDHPAQLCKDLHNCQNTLYDGTYWIDPNLGCSSDSIEVTCNFTGGGRTCLRPITTTKLEFSVRRVQMNFIHLLSSGAEQRITIHCLNTTIWRHAPSLLPAQNAVRFQAWSGETLKPDVLADTCWQLNGRWQRADFLFRVSDPTLLPVVRLSNLPKTTPTSRLHLEVGPVCFL
ncbi:Collagen alpha-1(XXVII) chain A [Triplophysa tibetana]|uniref:Collagen alpha-1(XXVII) chain A n=1 Tax=Triplophysa tibetana TaxID=1572043 RepID=A0A5A9PDJ3_9TELE|nr:Collagen alpha-1(XXVII) chain A [Triplophysa tibetana]